MKLSSVHFATLLPIPGTSRRESSLHASDGWALGRSEDGRITCARFETVDGGERVTRRFTVEGWPCVYEESTDHPLQTTSDVLAGKVPSLIAPVETQGPLRPEPLPCNVLVEPETIDASLAKAPSEPAPEPPTGKRRRK